MARAGRFVADLRGYRQVLNSVAVQSEVQAKADAIVKAAEGMLDSDEGYRLDDYDVAVFTTKTGGHGRAIRTQTDHARRSQAKNKTLAKALKSL